MVTNMLGDVDPPFFGGTTRVDDSYCPPQPLMYENYTLDIASQTIPSCVLLPITVNGTQRLRSNTGSILGSSLPVSWYLIHQGILSARPPHTS